MFPPSSLDDFLLKKLEPRCCASCATTGFGNTQSRQDLDVAVDLLGVAGCGHRASSIGKLHGFSTTFFVMVATKKVYLGGGFKYVLCSPLFGEMIQFD